MEIRELTKEEVERLSCLRKERVNVKWDEKTMYLGAIHQGNPIGVVGCQRLGKRNLRYKTDGVLEAWRGMGVYTLLWRAREELCYTGSEIVSAYCTEKSLACYLAHGFKALSVRNGITFVKRF